MSTLLAIGCVEWDCNAAVKAVTFFLSGTAHSKVITSNERSLLYALSAISDICFLIAIIIFFNYITKLIVILGNLVAN